MASELSENNDLLYELKKMQICRFCLSHNKLTSIFVKPANVASLAPLTVQVMACASIEIFSNDGMPSLICQECRVLFEHSYRFKQMCKRADTLLRQFPLTGKMPEPLERPKIPQSLFAHQTTTTSTSKKIIQPIKKILNAAPAVALDGPAPMRFTVKTEPTQDEMHLLNKVDNNEEISIEDVQKIISNAGDEDFIYDTTTTSTTNNNNSPPKLLNKTTKRLLTIDLDKELEPQFSKPKMQVNLKGHMEMVTAIVQPSKEDTTTKDNNKDNTKVANPVDTDNFPCPFCERSFPLLQLRDIHLTRHNRERNFQCPDCDKSFFSKYDLQKHEVRHTGERPFKCQVCEKSFTRQTLLHRHERVHTDIPKYLCMYCEKPFISKDELETHISRHEKNRPFKCQQCGKSFAFKQGLERHEVVHSAVLPYPCQYCDQSFTTPSKLSRHLNAHAGDRPFPCKYCNKSYLLSHHLTRHLRSHKQEKSSEYQCTDCKKVFNTREALIYHTAVHSTANLTCTLCHMEFDSADEVAVHIKLHVDGETFACEFCDLLFLSADELFTHYDVKHTTEVDQFKYIIKDAGDDASKSTTTTNKKRTKKTVNVVAANDDAEEDNLMADVNESFDLKKQEELLTELDGDDENVIATIHKIFNYEHLDDTNQSEFMPSSSAPAAQQKPQEKPKILNQIVFSSNSAQNIFQSKSNENLNDSSPPSSTHSSAKTRKVVARDGKLHLVEQQAADNKQTTMVQRRKVPEKPVEIKIEKEDAPLPTLPTLPKGVSVRKTSVANNNSKPATAAAAATSEQKTIKKMTLAEAQAVVSEKRAKQSDQTKETKTATSRTTRSSGGGKTSTGNVVEIKTEKGAETPASSKSPQQKQTKVKQIRMTKAMADELAKQGRIKFKDGNMILTKPSK